MQRNPHSAYIESWLDATAADSSAPRLLALLERALSAMWDGASVMLGDVTLTAIVDRVLYTASEQYPFVSIAKIDATWTTFAVRQLGTIQNTRRLREVVRFVLGEFLTVLGNLTDEILTPTLHAALSTVGTTELEPDAEAGESTPR